MPEDRAPMPEARPLSEPPQVRPYARAAGAPTPPWLACPGTEPLCPRPARSPSHPKCAPMSEARAEGEKKNALCPLGPHSAVPVARKKSKKYIHSRNRFPRLPCVLQRRRSCQPRPAAAASVLRAARSRKRAVKRRRARSDMETCPCVFSIFYELLGPSK